MVIFDVEADNVGIICVFGIRAERGGKLKVKITIEKFGPINKFEYDLEKDLIITYGNNNIGKSYAMQIVYLLLKTFIHNMFIMPEAKVYLYPHHIDSSLPEGRLESLVRIFMESNEQTKDITQDIVAEVSYLTGLAVMPVFLNSCRNTFGNFEIILENNPVITIDYDSYHYEIDLKAGTINGKIGRKPVRLCKTGTNLQKPANTLDYLDIYVSDQTEKNMELILEQINFTFMKFFYLITSNLKDVYFLPASRSGIYAGMNAFGSIVAELSQNRAYITKKIELPGISEPISDYFIALSNIKSRANEGLQEIYGSIEDDILKGKVTFDKSKNALMYTPEHVNLSYEMTEVSSIVSEISPIVAFLKYIITTEKSKSKSILFIEEPEAHLHPNNQIALIEIFARLIEEDVKLIMSSHSNYVFNKMNNLILAKKLDYHFYDPIVLEDREKGSVSKHVTVDELGSDDENFVDVSQHLYDEREEIIEELNTED